MVFVEFTAVDYPFPNAKHHFMGADLEGILANTKNGTEFGFAHFSGHRLISQAEARSLGLGYLDKGIRAVKGGCKSYKLQTPRDR